MGNEVFLWLLFLVFCVVVLLPTEADRQRMILINHIRKSALEKDNHE